MPSGKETSAARKDVPVIDVPVLIVGAGGSGLSASIFLGDLGVGYLTIERHPSTSHRPKAHYLNQRTMEIFRQHGAADAVYAKAAPRRNLGKIRWMTSVGGDGPLDRIQYAAPPMMGAGELAPLYDAKGTTHPTNIPQIRLEPVLREVAEKRHPGRILFRHELLSLAQDAQGVTARVKNLDEGTELSIRCRYLIAADAGKTVGPALGIEMLGKRKQGDFVTVWFAADLSEYIKDDDAVMRRIYHPAQPYRFASLLTFGPDHWDGRSGEWASSFTHGRRLMSDAGIDQVSDEQLAKEVFEFMKIDVPVKVLGVSRWSLETLMASRFADGRVFLIGDAAHQHPPGGGLGLNSGFQDAHNIAWKLALVLKGLAPASLLESYEIERRPVIQRNVDWGLLAMTNSYVLMAALGAIPGETPEQSVERFKVFLSDTPLGETRRAQVKEIFHAQRVEYAIHDMEMGYTYPNGALVDDGSPPAWRDPMGADYRPNTRPGSRLPHAWLNLQGRRCSTHDLIPMGGFLLITGRSGLDWCAAAARIAAESGVTLHAVRIGDGCDASDPSDPSGTWTQACQIADDGAVLVRPDAHVAFRSQVRVADPYQVLRDALEAILKAGAPTAQA